MHRDDLKAACLSNRRKTIPFPAPELPAIDGTLYVRELRGDDLRFIAESENGIEDRYRWALRGLSDAAGNRILADADLAWAAGEEGLPTPLVERAYFAVKDISGWTEENRRSFLTPSAGTTGSGSPIS